ncbi:helix-turn-helix transcriptional regulator [Anaerocolumna sp. AGMB13025]|uniref:helix-turn-helix domain-containing protein n=1 Tax=Anaerocolumna sp. AGMB13025 TaxID=3039116 RepID=UPI0024203D80|nr:helix-turn-helix transcriptional regulator [Anaerocolumna sp. AGMB13025]WFR55487.1 helix-turn-helix transcriptional regulator [Anaerocolumna sp. AGMB13025]
MQTILIESLHQNKLRDFLNKILLMDQKTLSDKAMGKNLLDILAGIFGYDATALWIKRPDESNYSLVAYRVDDTIIEKYNQEFYQHDPLNPSKIIGKTDVLNKKNVITIKDVMSFQEFIKSKYYCEFLCKGDYLYETVIYLRYRDEVIGCLGILKRKNELDFTEEEIKFMNTLSYFLSVFTNKHFSVSNLMEDKNLFESISNQSPIGIIVFDINKPISIRYINSSALRYTVELMNDLEIQAPGESFIAKYIEKEIACKQFGMTKTLLSVKNKPYFINVVPSHSIDSNSLMMYVYIIPQNGIDTAVKTPNIEVGANLTERQLEIINCVLQGKTNSEIAGELFISVNTVKTHLNNIYKELNVVNRLGLYSKLINE